jgi:hypothetical protein
MTIPAQAVGFGCIGVMLVLWTLSCLWLGEIRSRHSVIYRSTDPFQFYAWIFGYTVIATLFIGAGILFWLHPQFNLNPSIDRALEE